MEVDRAVVPALAAVLTLVSCSPRAGPAAARATPSPLVDPAKVIPGGPPPDGIPPIDHPKFVDAADVGFLTARDPVIAVELNGEDKAYPLRILVWHEIVNDTVGGVPVAVTYCPLCNTGVAFRRPVIGGRQLDFGTSGKLYDSNLVMYDRQTNSYWSQVTGLAIEGALTGTRLPFVPAETESWADWKRAHASGRVLSEETGFNRPYGINPYAGYDSPGAKPAFFTGKPDPRLPEMARVLGIVAGGEITAVPFSSLASGAVGGWSVRRISLGGRPIVVIWEQGTASVLDRRDIADSKDVGSAAAFSALVSGRSLSFGASENGIFDRQTGTRWNVEGTAVAGPLAGSRLTPVLSIESFWFDWAAFHPGTSIAG